MITNSPDWDYHTLGAQAEECDFTPRAVCDSCDHDD